MSTVGASRDDRAGRAGPWRWQTLVRIGFVVALSVVLVLCAWTLLAIRARPEARASLVSDSTVTVVRTDTHISFSPARHTPTAGLLFFAGALVDPVSYGPILRRVAESGYTGILVTLPNRGLLGGFDGPDVLTRGVSAVAELKGVERWVLAGHSRGAGAAARLAQTNGGAFAALVLIASSDPRKFSLASTSLPVTQIYGTRDGVERLEQVERNLRNLPASTRRIRIDGGNHSQFAYYGLQPGDWRATITREAQQQVVVSALLEILAGQMRTERPAPAASLPR